MVRQVVLHPSIRSAKPSVLKRELKKRIKTRVDCPIEPGCWLLIDEKDQGLLSLDRRFFEEVPGALKPRRGQHVTMRQALFQLVFHHLPPVGRIIKMRCGEPRCFNPAHFEIAGWQFPEEIKRKMIGENWMSIEEAGIIGREYAPWYKQKIGGADD